MKRITRRTFGGSALVAWCFGSPAWAASGAGERPRTPAQTEGPFYPLSKPRTPGSNLVHSRDAGVMAKGELLRLRGRVTDPRSNPLARVTVEIWQVDHQGIYNHPRARGRERFDPGFQGYGESLTDAEGRYEFLTIVPATYPGRPPHIHVKLRIDGEELLTTQLYLQDHPQNARDGILARLLGSGSKADLFIDPAPAGTYRERAVQQAGFEFVV